mmetsp:Transcript_16129/g.13674  ORF Transcript_16129/g.13674 Transcript_16129/m.13674 type:complete len:274 (+) Transcript_16129:3639-4460(+)
MEKNLLSGGKDGKVIVWSWSGGLNKVQEFVDMNNHSKLYPGISSIDSLGDGSTLLIGTRGAEIYEVKKNGQAELLLQGHYDGELWGLACSPDSSKYVTCGGDSTVRLWDSKKLWMLANTLPLENDVRAIDWSRDGKFIVCADVKGKVMLFDPNKLNQIDSLQSSFTKKNQWIEDIKVSPDNSMVAFGAHGGASPIEIMNVKNGRSLSTMKKINVGLTSALLHLDWSTDSSSLVCNSQAYELMFINVQSGKQISASSSQGIEWATWTCKLGWPV